MIFDLDKRTVALGVGEFSSFSLGPREAGDGGGSGIWRAQLGTRWHNELRSRAVAEHADAAQFEVPITGSIVHRGWTFSFNGRIDQIIRPASAPPVLASIGPEPSARRAIPAITVLREIKSVTRPLPADEVELRREYPEYFVQLATYLALSRQRLLAPSPIGAEAGVASEPTVIGSPNALRGELVFVEASAGLAQTVPVSHSDDALFVAQLEQLAEFLNLRLRARERLRGLRYRPAFASPRPGQETTLGELTTTFERRPLVLFEAPTGFGKTGVLLEFALGQLRSGHFDRALYLTSKSTGQLQVVRTLQGMTGPSGISDLRFDISDSQPSAAGSGISNLKSQIPPPAPSALSPLASPLSPPTTPVAVWHVRNKAEHCVNATFHCVRDNCSYIAGAAERWPASGLSRFYLDEQHARDLDALKAAGREARICPYEITRAALTFNDVWLGDYNYVFAPSNRGLFYDQPGFEPARTLLIVDEAHNLPSRVADSYSHAFSSMSAYGVLEELHRVRPLASLVAAWDHWCHFLNHLKPNEGLSASEEDDALHLLGEVARQVSSVPVDFAALGASAADALWQVPSLLDELNTVDIPRLWWSPRGGELAITCLDAATAIGATLREYGGVVLASATLTPVDGFSAACGLDAPPEVPVARAATPERLGALNKRTTRKLYKQLTSAAELLRVEEARDAASPSVVKAHAPWRDGTYDIVFDARVDTSFQHRTRYFAATAATVVALRGAASAPVAVFFPSYAYAEAIRAALASAHPGFRVVVQPKVRDLAAQSAWVDESLVASDALLLVLGSSFAEGIDSLGGRITHAMIVGPALPEVNAVQRARLAEAARRGLSREASFRQVYQIPGMTKVNQALGRLVRGPGQHARVILHCRRFLDEGYLSLLAPEYRTGTTVLNDEALRAWLL